MVVSVFSQCVSSKDVNALFARNTLHRSRTQKKTPWRAKCASSASRRQTAFFTFWSASFSSSHCFSPYQELSWEAMTTLPFQSHFNESLENPAVFNCNCLKKQNTQLIIIFDQVRIWIFLRVVPKGAWTDATINISYQPGRQWARPLSRYIKMRNGASCF